MAKSDLPEYDLSRPRNGQVAMWARGMILAASVATVAVAFVGPRLVLDLELTPLREHPLVRYGLGCLVILALSVAWFGRGRVSLAARTAVILPIAHLVVLVAAAAGWFAMSGVLETARDLTPLVQATPMGLIVGAIAVVIAGAAWAIARRRRREVVQVAVTIALVELLLLGLWLPIASHVAPGWFDMRHDWTSAAHLFTSPIRLSLLALVPPLVGAIAFAAVSTRCPGRVDAARGQIVVAILGLLALGSTFRMGARANELTVYLNFVPWLLAAALVAVAAIAALCATSLLAAARDRRATSRERRQMTGVVSGALDEIIGIATIRSWLRGPEVMVAGFEVETSDGIVPVPPGARLAAPLPLSTTVLAVGEGVAVLRGGATVALSGFADDAGGAPFRKGPTATIGDGGFTVGTSGDPGSPFDQIALAAWRPCVAYLVIFVVAALPALAGLCAPR